MDDPEHDHDVDWNDHKHNQHDDNDDNDDNDDTSRPLWRAEANCHANKELVVELLDSSNNGDKEAENHPVDMDKSYQDDNDDNDKEENDGEDLAIKAKAEWPSQSTPSGTLAPTVFWRRRGSVLTLL